MRIKDVNVTREYFTSQIWNPVICDECIRRSEIFDSIHEVDDAKNNVVCAWIAKNVAVVKLSHGLRCRNSTHFADCDRTTFLCIAVVDCKQAHSDTRHSFASHGGSAEQFANDHVEQRGHR